jgi:hypothetical protein
VNRRGNARNPIEHPSGSFIRVRVPGRVWLSVCGYRLDCGHVGTPEHHVRDVHPPEGRIWQRGRLEGRVSRFPREDRLTSNKRFQKHQDL